MSAIYLDEFKRVARTAFAMWNRDPASGSFGSFDRQYWGWKYKDFGDSTLQYAARLAIEYASLQQQTSTLPRLIDGYVSYCARIQLRDGSFDQCYPYERTPGVIYDILSTLIYVRNCPYVGSDSTRGELDRIIARAARFALETDETHGAIANHFAEYSYELFNYAAYAGDDRARTRAEDYLERTLGLLEPAEGWFQEYDGPDAGYQTRTLRYLVKIAALLDRPALWDVIARAAGFVEELLMPDGSVHPMLGSRSTALIYPSAFETLAAREPRYGELAERIHRAWEQDKVPLPSCIDFANAIRLAHDALDAAIARAERPDSAAGAASPRGNVHFPKAGIAINRTHDRALYLGYRLGGVVVVYVRDVNGAWRLAGEDSGYLLKSRRNSESWITRMPGAGRLLEQRDNHYLLEAPFQRALHDEVTPARLLLLRLLNLTVLRSRWLGDVFRKLVVRHLMSGRSAAPLALERRIELEDAAVRLTDNITGDPGFFARELAALYRCRRVTGTHMASARYFQGQELEAVGVDWLEPVPCALNTPLSRTVAIRATPR